MQGRCSPLPWRHAARVAARRSKAKWKAWIEHEYGLELSPGNIRRLAAECRRQGRIPPELAREIQRLAALAATSRRDTDAHRQQIPPGRTCHSRSRVAGTGTSACQAWPRRVAGFASEYPNCGLITTIQECLGGGRATYRDQRADRLRVIPADAQCYGRQSWDRAYDHSLGCGEHRYRPRDSGERRVGRALDVAVYSSSWPHGATRASPLLSAAWCSWTPRPGPRPNRSSSTAQPGGEWTGRTSSSPPAPPPAGHSRTATQRTQATAAMTSACPAGPPRVLEVAAEAR